MINEAFIDSMAMHVVGNRMNDETLALSKSCTNIDDELISILSSFFISLFKTEKYFKFHHQSGLENNEVFKAVSSIFDNPDSLHESSVKIAEYLYDITNSTKIKGGEFYAVYFRECCIDGEELDAVGLFKSENRETFLKIYPVSDSFILEKEEGISLRKIDKGCIIFNSEKNSGYMVAIADGIKGADEKYWIDDFLQLEPVDNPYTQTQSLMKTCRDFVEEKLPEEFRVDKADKIDLLNKSMSYFKSHDVYSQPEFEQEVFQQPEIIESFREYNEHNNIPADLTFEIEPQAVKQQSKILKSILKLDKNFHIYIHGDRSMIERGEENGKKFYKMFFNEEN